MLQPEVLETILNSCLYGGNLVVTDMLEADLKGDLPVDKRSSTCKPDGDKTVHAVEEDQTDMGRSQKHQKAHLKPTSLLPYLGKRPKLVSFYMYISDFMIRTYLGISPVKIASMLMY